MTLPATDNFTASNGTQLETYNASWTIQCGAIDINVNAACPDAAATEGAAFWNADAFNADQYSQGVIKGLNSSSRSIGVAVRVNTGTTNSYYGIYANINDKYLFKSVAGTWTEIASASAYATNDVIRLEVEGTTLTPMVNGALDTDLGEQTDTSLASGAAGLSSYGDSAGTLIDDWEGGNLGGGGTEYPQAVSGGMTPSGAAVMRTGKVAAGGVTPAGALVNRAAKVVSGAITPAGTLINRAGKILAGGITPSGVVSGVKIALVAVGGALEPAGALVNRAGKILAGAITPDGGLVRRIGKVLAGGMTPSGVVSGVKTALISIGGALEPAGVLARRTGKVLAGVITPDGGLVRRTGKILAGALAGAGELATEFFGGVITQAVGGSLAPVGELVKMTSKSLAGILAPDGGLVRRIGKILAGALGLAGAVVAQMIGLPVPASRIYAIDFEDRVLAIDADDRIYAVLSENRTFAAEA